MAGTVSPTPLQTECEQLTEPGLLPVMPDCAARTLSTWHGLHGLPMRLLAQPMPAPWPAVQALPEPSREAPDRIRPQVLPFGALHTT